MCKSVLLFFIILPTSLSLIPWRLHIQIWPCHLYVFSCDRTWPYRVSIIAFPLNRCAVNVALTLNLLARRIPNFSRNIFFWVRILRNSLARTTISYSPCFTSVATDHLSVWFNFWRRMLIWASHLTTNLSSLALCNSNIIVGSELIILIVLSVVLFIVGSTFSTSAFWVMRTCHLDRAVEGCASNIPFSCHSVQTRNLHLKSLNLRS